MSEVADPEEIGLVDAVQPAPETAEPEVPKQRIKRPTRPDDAAHKQKVEVLQDIGKFCVHFILCLHPVLSGKGRVLR